MGSESDYQWYKSHGICVRCKKRDAFGTYVQCEECLYKQQLRNIENADKHKEYFREYRKKRKARLKAAGLCPECGKPKQPDRSMCKQYKTVMENLKLANAKLDNQNHPWSKDETIRRSKARRQKP